MAKCVCGHGEKEHQNESSSGCIKCHCPRFKKSPFFQYVKIRFSYLVYFQNNLVKVLFVALFGIILFSQSLAMSYGQWTDYNDHDPGTTQVVPDWIRNNAAWWADGYIDDQTFVSGIDFLIK